MPLSANRPRNSRLLTCWIGRPLGSMGHAARALSRRRGEPAMTDRERELQDLRRLSVPDLCARYEAVYGLPPRVRHRVWLWKRIAWRLEERRCGGLSRVAQARLEQLIAEIDIPLPEKAGGVAGAPPPSSPKPAEPVDGTTLVRDYKERQIAATRVDGGWEYEGEVYGSLSAVATAVTGSKWNGRLFFGLTGRGAKSK